MEKVVDFPAPFGPNKPKISPLFIQNFVFLTAKVPVSYFLMRPSTLIVSLLFYSTRVISS